MVVGGRAVAVVVIGDRVMADGSSVVALVVILGLVMVLLVVFVWHLGGIGKHFLTSEHLCSSEFHFIFPGHFSHMILSFWQTTYRSSENGSHTRAELEPSVVEFSASSQIH